MKNVKRIFCGVVFLFLCSPVCRAQEQEIKQLLLNVEKLAQFTKILNDMYKGYKILRNGYNLIKNISEGNFNIHKGYLDGLLAVSPAVKKYKRVAEIIDYQLKIVSQYKSAYKRFSQDKNFTVDELDYMAMVYANLSDLCLKNLDDLAMVITAGKLRMSDDERILAIDKIYSEIVQEYSFLNDFNETAKVLSSARTKEQSEVNLTRGMLGVK